MIRVAASPVTHHFDTTGERLAFHSGTGAHVVDARGRRYVDLVCGFGPVVVGHADAEWTDLLAEQLTRGVHLPGYADLHEEYARDLLGDRAGDRAVAYFTHSSDAVTAAIRLSALRTGRPSFVRCGYIGWHDAQIAQSPRWHEPPGSPLRPEVRYSTGFRGVLGDETPYDWVDLDPASLRSALAEGRHACFVIDAYQAHFCPADVLHQAVEMCRAAGVAVVLDETKTAGRVSPLGQLTDLHADAEYIVCGKAIANGAPLSLLVGPEELTDTVGAARVSGTFSKSLLSVYAARATRRVLASRGGHKGLARVGGQVVAAAREAVRRADVEPFVDAETVFGGSLWELVWSRSLLGSPAVRDSLRRHLADAGVLALQGHPSFVALAHGDLDLEELTDSFARGFGSWRDAHRTELKEPS